MAISILLHKPKDLGLWVGGSFFGLALLLALLGYWVMPDSTPYANNSLLELSKKPFGFQVWVLKKKRLHVPPPQSAWERFWHGSELPYEMVPLAGMPQMRDGQVQFSVYSDISSLRPFERIPLSELYGPALSESMEQRTFWLGTDKVGRDVLSRLIYGTRVSIHIGFTCMAISLLLGLVLGGLSGYFGGWMDRVVLWLMAVFWSLPILMLVVAIRLLLQSDSLWATYLGVGAAMWVEVARVVRGQVLEAKEKGFVEVARTLGFSHRRIIFAHIMPGLAAPLLIVSVANFATAILTEASLSFLGLGGPAEMPSWGAMVKEGLPELMPNGRWSLLVLPCLATSLLVLSVNMLGNSLRNRLFAKSSA